MNRNKHYMRGILCTLLGGTCWGFSGACGQILVKESAISSAWVTAVRMLFAGIILTTVSIIKNKENAFELFKNKKHSLRLILFAVFGLIFSQFTYLKAISYSNAGTATVLQYIGPVFVMLYVCSRTKHLPDKSELLAILFAFSGVAVLATHGDFSSLKLSFECLFWGLLAAVSLMLYSLLPKELIKEYGSVAATGWGMLTGGIIMSLAVRPWNIPAGLTLYSLFALGGMVLVGTVLSYTLYLQGVNDIGSVKASMLACAEPVSAALFSFFWLKTRFEPADILGFALILSTVFILSKNK